MKKKLGFGRLVLVATFLVGSVGCGGDTTPKDSSTPEVENPGPLIDPDIDTDSLNGVLPENPKPPIEFAALNYDEGSRSKSDLVGQRTVLWFFPFAGTPG